MIKTLTMEEAKATLEKLNSSLIVPALAPEYIIADSHRDPNLKPVFFSYSDGKDIFYHPFHLSKIPDTELFDIQSAYGYGGPVSSSRDPSFLKKAWDVYAAWCKENSVLAEFVRFHPLLQNWVYYSGEAINVHNTVWIDLQQINIGEPFKPKVMSTVRKNARDGLTVSWHNDAHHMEDFIEIYFASMQAIKTDPFYYFKGPYFSELFRWKNTHLAICKLGTQIVAVAMFLFLGETIEYHLAASTDEGKRLSAMNLILFELIKRAKESKFKRIHLGGGISDEPDDQLLFFKSKYSDLKGDYKIGRTVYRQDDYNRIKLDWENRHQKKAMRVLFYR